MLSLGVSIRAKPTCRTMLFLQDWLDSIDTNSLKRFIFLHLFHSNRKGLCVVNDLLYDQDSYLDPPKKEFNFIVLKVEKKKELDRLSPHILPTAKTSRDIWHIAWHNVWHYTRHYVSHRECPVYRYTNSETRT